MYRRRFLGHSLTGGMFASSAAAMPQGPLRNTATAAAVFVERDQPGLPHKGKVLAAIQPHCDDIPLFAAGAILKLIKEGYRGILIRTSNDEAAGAGATVGEVVLNNERDNFEVANLMGLDKVFDLHYRNHRMDGVDHIELRARLIFIFRVMKVDTIFCYDPWGHYEENPDHYVTAQCVEAACWMSGSKFDFPEHFEAGLQPKGIREKYYYARGPQLVNRVVDISSVFEQKIAVNRANIAQGPAGETGAKLRAELAGRNLRLPVLGGDDETANREYIRHFVLNGDAEVGRQYGVAYAEQYHYIGPPESPADEYIRLNAVPL